MQFEGANKVSTVTTTNTVVQLAGNRIIVTMIRVHRKTKYVKVRIIDTCNISGNYSEEDHLFSSRTQKLSSFAPTILGGRPPGKIGRCRSQTRSQFILNWLFLYIILMCTRGYVFWQLFFLYAIFIKLYLNKKQWEGNVDLDEVCFMLFSSF